MSDALNIEFFWGRTSHVPPSGAHARVTEARLPLLVWQDVPIVREELRKLSVLERFLTQFSLTLEQFDESDVVEVTGMPVAAVTRLLRKLARTRIVEHVGSEWHVNETVATKALESETSREFRRGVITVVCLPLTGDWLMVDANDDSPLATVFERESPDHQAPVPRHLAGRALAEVLTPTTKWAQTIRGFVRVEGVEGCVPQNAPCYSVWGTVDTDGTADLKIGSRAVTLPRCEFTQNVRRMHDQCVQSASFGDGLLPSQTNAIPNEDGSVTLSIDAKSAESAARQGLSLSDCESVIGQTSDVRLAWDVRFEPMNQDAALWFALAEIEPVLRQSPMPTQTDAQLALDAALRRRNIPSHAAAWMTTETIVSHLWNRKAYDLVYALRNEEDFGYE